MYSILDTPVEYLKGVGPQRAEMLKKELGIFTYTDLISYYPFRYIDKSKFFKVSEINSELAYVQLKGFINQIELIGGKRIVRMTARFRDETGSLELIWFNGFKWLKDKFNPNQEYIVFGKPTLFNNKYNITHPEISLPTDEDNTIVFKLQSFYRTSEKLKAKGIDSKGIHKLIKTLLVAIQDKIPETLSEPIIQNLKLISRQEAIIQIHFPVSQEILQKA